MLYDVVIIGGGINGCGCAADAALRGLSVLLCEQDDIASKTSSSSSKLIHGGLRYLEHYDLSMVKKALDEQQTLMDLAPHLVHPLPFVLPHDPHGRPMWLLRAGLFLYDHLSCTNTLPNSKYIDRKHNPVYFNPLRPVLTHGFIFYDCKTDDARLTLINALQARDHGATIAPQTSLIQAEVLNHQWQLTLKLKSGSTFQIQAKVVINATGPWVESVSQLLSIPLEHSMSLVKGSHMIVPKLYEGEHAYLLQHDDKRVIFIVPYHGHTMIGTTDVTYTDTLHHIDIVPDEINYLSELVHHYFNKPFNTDDIIMTWSGVRPLLSSTGKNAAELSRDYAFHYSDTPAPAVTIYGGKITTYRQLASQAIDQLHVIFPNMDSSHSKATSLPGATYHHMSFAEYQHHARDTYSWLDEKVLNHYIETYGTLTEHILKDCTQPTDLGIAFSSLLYQTEVDYLVREEWASSVDDILWRRTKLGLSITDDERQRLANYLLDFGPKT
ncbi:MAG: glycerol-3-phosphate dehydrogenase [Legionellaceae bacterium]|nr:glycerol-3-phosphate dehydrogenase [Legionellaceae bacterium]